MRAGRRCKQARDNEANMTTVHRRTDGGQPARRCAACNVSQQDTGIRRQPAGRLAGWSAVCLSCSARGRFYTRVSDTPELVQVAAGRAPHLSACHACVRAWVTVTVDVTTSCHTCQTPPSNLLQLHQQIPATMYNHSRWSTHWLCRRCMQASGQKHRTVR